MDSTDNYNEFPEVPNTPANNGPSGSPPPPPPPMERQTSPRPAAPPAPIPVYIPSSGGPAGPPRRSVLSGILRFFLMLIFIGSLILNIYLGLIVYNCMMQQREYRSGDEKNKIVLIDLQGTINMNTAESIHSMLKLAADDKHIKGVILVVNSPGGQVNPSDMINKYVTDFITELPDKKIYAAVQQVSASGACWATASVNKIFAQTNSTVGSIGVLYMNFVLENTLKQKLGMDPIVIKSTRSPFKDMGSPFRMPTEEEKQKITEEVDKIHARFVEVISKGRDIPQADVWKLASGDVYDGPEAKGNKLIDEVGFLDNAIDDMAEALGIQNPQVVRFYKQPTLKEMLIEKQDTGLNIQQQLEYWTMTPRIQALWLGEH